MAKISVTAFFTISAYSPLYLGNAPSPACSTSRFAIYARKYPSKTISYKISRPVVIHLIPLWTNRSFSCSKKESGSNDISLHFVEFSNVHNTHRSSNATQSNFVYKMYKNIARSRLICRTTKGSIRKMLVMGLVMFGTKFHFSFWSMIHLLLNLNTCSGYYQRKSFGCSPEEPDASRSALDSAQYRPEGHRPSSFLC